MWIVRWESYESSKLATFVSLVGALLRYSGAICLFTLFKSQDAKNEAVGLIVAAVILFGIGIGFHFLADRIAYG